MISARFVVLVFAAIALRSAEAGCFAAPDADGHVSAVALQAALDQTSTPTHLPTNAFNRCDGAWQPDLYPIALISIDIPNSVTSFGDSCFERAPYLTTVNFGAGSQLTTIGDDTFLMVSNTFAVNSFPNWVRTEQSAAGSYDTLTQIAFPSGLTHIGEGTFKGAYQVTKINFPATLVSIGKNTCDGMNTPTTAITTICGATNPSLSVASFQFDTTANDNVLVPRMRAACTADEIISPCLSTCTITGTSPNVKIIVHHGINPSSSFHRCFQGTSGACTCVCGQDMNAPYTTDNRHANALIGN
jgi:hypothetical protein